MLKFKRSIIAFAGLLLIAGAVGTLIPLVSQGQGNSQHPPLAVRDVENPGRQPFSADASLSQGNGGLNSTVNIFTVPAGKRFVLQDAGALVLLPPGQKGSVVLVRRDSNNTQIVARPLTLTFQHLNTSSIPNTDVLEASESAVMYLEPGEKLGASLARDSSVGIAGAGVVVTGYFINLP